MNDAQRAGNAASDRYFLAVDGKPTGPFPRSDLASMVRSGDASPADLVWNEGLEGWTPLAEILPAAPRPNLAHDGLPAIQVDASTRLVVRNALFFGGAVGAGVLLFFTSLALMADSPTPALVLLLASLYLCWWAWLEFCGVAVQNGRIGFARRLPFWPYVIPLFSREFDLQDVAIGDSFSAGVASHGLVLVVESGPVPLLFDSVFARDAFVLALRSMGVADAYRARRDGFNRP
jgi:hypothetical protein